jgi:hypothetical protein
VRSGGFVSIISHSAASGLSPQESREETKGRMSSNQYRERFIRWQSVTIIQLGYTVNLILGLATGSLGFSLTLLKDKHFTPQNWEKFSLICHLPRFYFLLLWEYGVRLTD